MLDLFLVRWYTHYVTEYDNGFYLSLAAGIENKNLAAELVLDCTVY